MKPSLKKSVSTLAMAASLLAGATWSTASHACSADSEFISSVCIMASPRLGAGFNNGQFVLADGRTLAVNQYQAAFSLIGITYGGDGSSNFMLPDLRGRVVVGAGQGPNLPAYPLGQKGGAVSVNLSVAQLPVHNHALSGTGATAVSGVGTLTAATALSGLTTTTNLAGVAFSATGANLALKASTTAAGSGSPTTTSFLGSNAGASSKIYGTATPDVTMATGSISGNVSGTLSGTAPGTVSGGTAATTLTGAPSLSGNTTPTGSGAAVPILQPYLALYYFFTLQGMYPTPD